MRLSVKVAAFVAVCIGAIYLYFTGYLEEAVHALGLFGPLGIAVLGAFYTSGITFPLAVAAFASVVRIISPVEIAAFGAAGATLADIAMLSMVEDAAGRRIRINEHFEIRIHEVRGAQAKAIMALAAGAMLALPFPDEIPIALLGLEKVDAKKIALFIYVSKFVGILAVSEAALLAYGP